MRLAFPTRLAPHHSLKAGSHQRAKFLSTYIFDVWAWVDHDDIAMLHLEVMSNDTIDAGATIVEVIVGQHDQHGVSAHLALDEDGVATEELEGLHGIVGEGNDGVVIVDSVSDTINHQLISSSGL